MEFVIRRALISTFNKTNLEQLAYALKNYNVEILSTGGSAQLLKSQNISVTDVSTYTGFPEIMDGRVKTLHPKIHGGLLARPQIDDSVLQEHQIELIDLLVVNLYPFRQVIANPDTDLATAIENIDIGGPAMIRAAAKNYQRVAVVVDPADYPCIIEELKKNNGSISQETRFALAKKAFAHTAQYDAAIANYLGTLNEHAKPVSFPDVLTCQFIKKQDLRYGENPHQNAAFYVDLHPETGSIATATQLQGKELSFNNIADADAALECVKSFENTRPACVIVKHANPCGVALGSKQGEAYLRAYECDPTSSFGGIIAFNQPLTAKTASTILEKQFLEVLIAPAVLPEALTILKNKPNIRVLSTNYWEHELKPRLDFKRINSGMLIQECDHHPIESHQWKVVSRRKPTDAQWQDMLFAWKVIKHIKSNAIVLVKDCATLGIGAGQMSRIDSVHIAAKKAKEAQFELKGAIMASDAFFPFRDGIDAAAQIGAQAVIHPGGSIRDEEIIKAADEANLVMIFTGVRHFKH